MSLVRFLLDQHVPLAIVQALLKEQPATWIATVGVDAWVPPAGTPDPTLLLFAEREQLVLVTYDRNTMPGHVADHLAGGRHTCGVIVFPDGNNLSPGTVAYELLVVLLASEAEEWIDQIRYLPKHTL